ncbi:MAG: DNA double-strand break repair nuclease NurA [Candidatus Thermoplasmatota archaeon]|nr:DNA double-strand break repair nuclease NurA [Candidatus Thermoplasmatota archaeon]
MNDTFSQFVSFLRENAETIRSDLLMPADSWRRSLYSDVFRENYVTFRDASSVSKVISATDSTEFVRELYNGKKIILIRSYTTVGKRVYTSFISKVMSVARDDLQRFLTMLMEHSEHLSILEMLRHERPDFILVDGSLSGRLFKNLNPVDAEGYDNFHEEYVQTLGKLVETVSGLNIPLIFMAKSSETSAFRKFLLNTLKNHRPKDEAVNAESRLKASDHYLVRSLARVPGYTKPIVQPVRKIWKEGDEKFPIVLTHILPRETDLPIKVDIVMSPDGYVPDTVEPTVIPQEIIDLMFWGYGDLKTYNIWLADVDRLVKFRSSEVENIYMKAFEKEIGISFYETRGERRARIRI